MQSSVHQTEVLLFFTLMELVVINVGLGLGVIPADVFTMLVIMAIGSTVVTTPALKIWLNLNKRANLESISQS